MPSPATTAAAMWWTELKNDLSVNPHVLLATGAFEVLHVGSAVGGGPARLLRIIDPSPPGVDGAGPTVDPPGGFDSIQQEYPE